MEFISYLQENSIEKQIREQLRKTFNRPEEETIRKYAPIEFNNGVYLSIQASFGYQCKPNITCDINQYTNMEVAILEGNGLFVTFEKYIGKTNIDDYYVEPIYSCVPVEVVEQVFQKLKEKIGLKK